MRTFLCLALAFSLFSICVSDNIEDYIVARKTLPNGEEIVAIAVPGRPPKIKAPVVSVPRSNPQKGTNILSNVPAFDWCYGCSATSAAMMMGHYDNSGYPNMYTGPANGGVCPMTNEIWNSQTSTSDGESPLSATHKGVDGRTDNGHVDDYWKSYGSTGPDPWESTGVEHTYGECTGDYMGTNQWKWESDSANTDGSTSFWFYNSGKPMIDYSGSGVRDGAHGIKNFVESRGYSIQTDGNYNQHIYGYNGNTEGFTFDEFKAEIDAGRPVLIHVKGHTMLGYGYDDSDETIYIHDTWDQEDHSMTWGGTYGTQNLQHYAVTVIKLETSSETATLTVDAYPSGSGTTSPSGSSTVNIGVAQTITATAASGSSFVSWTSDGQAVIANSSSASTTVTLSGNATVTANFKSDSGTTAELVMVASPTTGGSTSPSGTSTVNIGVAQTITATAASGSAFSSWSSKGAVTIANSTSATTTATLLGDSEITANFDSSASMTASKITVNLQNAKDGKDSLNVKKAVYPSSASSTPSSATITVNGTKTYECSSLEAKGTKYTFKTDSGTSPQYSITIDTDKGEWNFSLKKETFGDDIDVVDDGITIALQIDGSTVGTLSFTFDELDVKTKVKYKGSDKSKINLNLQNVKVGKDSASVKKAAYPSSASSTPSSATVIINGIKAYECASLEAKGTKYTFKTDRGTEPQYNIKIDTGKSLWDFNLKKETFNDVINVVDDGASFVLQINGSTATTISKTFDELDVKTQIKYPVKGKEAGAYSISGTIKNTSGSAVSGVSVALSGTASATATTGSGGAYSFTGLSDGSYTVTPSLSGYTFSPSSQSVTVSGASQTDIDFTASGGSGGTYTISGTVSGDIAAGVSLVLSGDSSGTTTSASDGTYSFTGLADGSYTVTPALSGYTFSPTSTAVTISGADSTGNDFTATSGGGGSYSISGTVSGDIAAGVSLVLSGDSSGTATSASDGTYSFTGLADGSYTVTPTLSGYTFSPTSTAVTISGANSTGNDFTATSGGGGSYSISGTISGDVIQDVALTLSGDSSALATSASDGTYSFTGLSNGSYTVTPALSGYTFSPTSTAVTISGANSTGNNFTSSTAAAGNNLWVTGSNLYGQLGDGTRVNKSTPIETFSSGVQAVSACNQTMIVKTDGSLWATGNNGSGQLGDGTTTIKETPVKIFSSGVLTTSCGKDHTMILKTDGSLWATGYNKYGQLGDEDEVSTSTPIEVISSGVQAVSAGWYHTMILKTDGSLWATGRNLEGQLGDGTTTNKSTPVEIFSSGVQAVSAGGYHTMIIKTDGSLWATGQNIYGGLGDGTTTSKSTPVEIFPSGVQAVSAGGMFSMILMTDGGLWATGENDKGQLGDGTWTNQSTPVSIYSNGVEAVATGNDHTIILKTDGSLWAAGYNEYGQLGDGTTEERETPVEIFSSGIKAVAAGINHTMIMKD